MVVARPLSLPWMTSGGTVMNVVASDMVVACTDDRTALLTPLVHATASSESGRLNRPPPWRTRPRPKMGQHTHHDGGGLNAVCTRNPNSFSRCFQKRLFAEPLRQLNNCSFSEVLQHGFFLLLLPTLSVGGRRLTRSGVFPDGMVCTL